MAINSASSSVESAATDITVMAPAWSAMYSRLLSGLTATHDGSAVTVRMSTIEVGLGAQHGDVLVVGDVERGRHRG